MFPVIFYQILNVHLHSVGSAAGVGFQVERDLHTIQCSCMNGHITSVLGFAALLRALPRRLRADVVPVPPRPSPVFYVYDSYHISDLEWAQVLGPEGRLTVRGSRLDGVFIGLWLDRTHGRG